MLVLFKLVFYVFLFIVFIFVAGFYLTMKSNHNAKRRNTREDVEEAIRNSKR